MNDIEMTAMVKRLTGDSCYAVPFLEAARAAVLSRMYPFDGSKKWGDVPERYHMRTCEIAAYLAQKVGAEGETQHIESDVSRTYGSAYIPSSMLADIPSFCGVPR